MTDHYGTLKNKRTYDYVHDKVSRRYGEGERYRVLSAIVGGKTPNFRKKPKKKSKTKKSKKGRKGKKRTKKK